MSNITDKVVVITGADSPGVVRRLNGLGLMNVLANVQDKKTVLLQAVQTLKIDLSTTIYIGDDIPDLEVMQLCGVPCCPADAAQEIASVSKYISPIKGGQGCVRDILEKVMKLQGKWA